MQRGLVLIVLFLLLGLLGCQPTFDCKSLQFGQRVDVHESLYHSTAEYKIGVKFGNTVVPMVADTGSSDLVLSAVQGSISQLSSQPVPLSYGSESGTVNVYGGNVSLVCGNSTPFQRIGVSTGENPSDASALSNIMGFAYANMSNIPQGAPAQESQPTFLDAYIEQNNLENTFSMMLCGHRGSKDKSQIVVGDEIEGTDAAAYKYTPVTSKNLYCVGAKRLQTADGKTVFGQFAAEGVSSQCASGPQVIVDSGTTLSLVPADMALALEAYMRNVYQTGKSAGKISENISDAFWNGQDPNVDDFDLALSDATLAQFPILQVVFDDGNKGEFTVDIAADTYFKDVGDGSRTFGFRASSGVAILGQVVMENAVVRFERDAGRVGFLPNNDLCK